jgi:hypothetical protein
LRKVAKPQQRTGDIADERMFIYVNTMARRATYEIDSQRLILPVGSSDSTMSDH